MTDNLEKARAARSAARDKEIWDTVSRTMKRAGCVCGLRKGMSREDLPSQGCKSAYICPALDAYRRMLPSTPVPEQELLMQEPWRALGSA